MEIIENKLIERDSKNRIATIYNHYGLAMGTGVLFYK